MDDKDDNNVTQEEQNRSEETSTNEELNTQELFRLLIFRLSCLIFRWIITFNHFMNA
jgi:hypothetical protein